MSQGPVPLLDVCSNLHDVACFSEVALSLARELWPAKVTRQLNLVTVGATGTAITWSPFVAFNLGGWRFPCFSIGRGHGGGNCAENRSCTTVTDRRYLTLGGASVHPCPAFRMPRGYGGTVQKTVAMTGSSIT